MKLKYLALIASVIMTVCATISCTKDNTDSDGTLLSMRWVDLGLPSGLLWADKNVGASTPEGYGDHFAWGELNTKSNYCWSTYKYSNSNGELTKYCSRALYGRFHFTDTLTILEADDDAASKHIGTRAHIPSKEEWEELIDNTYASWTTQNGVSGILFVAPNGNSLFLPAAGVYYDRTFDNENIGCYWSRTLETGFPTDAWGFEFGPTHQDMNSIRRYKGCSVRAVK